MRNSYSDLGQTLRLLVVPGQSTHDVRTCVNAVMHTGRTVTGALMKCCLAVLTNLPLLCLPLLSGPVFATRACTTAHRVLTSPDRRSTSRVQFQDKCMRTSDRNSQQWATACSMMHDSPCCEFQQISKQMHTGTSHTWFACPYSVRKYRWLGFVIRTSELSRNLWLTGSQDIWKASR